MTDPMGATGGGGLGARLRAARERAGFSSLQAAAKLHLDPRMIEALEAEEFTTLGAPVYVRGHLRRYAELLDAPADELLGIYAAQVEASAPPDLAQLKPTEPIRATRQLAGPVVGIIVAGTVIAGIWLALKGLPTASLPNAAAPAAQSRSIAPAPGPGAAATVSPPAASTARGTTAPGTTAIEAPAATVAQGAVATGVMRLRLVVRADSWVEVHDARDARVYYDLARAPATLSLSGAAPLRVLLGYADGVAIEVDGRAVAVPAALRRGRSASFLVASNGAVTAAP